MITVRRTFVTSVVVLASGAFAATAVAAEEGGGVHDLAPDGSPLDLRSVAPGAGRCAAAPAPSRAG